MANDAPDFVQRGKMAIVRRQYSDAVKICRLGLLANPGVLEGRLVLGMALTSLGRWDEVLAEMRVALEQAPDSALALLLKGEALVGKGDYLKAEVILRRAKLFDPTNQKADLLLSEIALARSAGFEGVTVEPTDTKVYPAQLGGRGAQTEERTGGAPARRALSQETGEVQVDEERTGVDIGPTGIDLPPTSPGRKGVAEAEQRRTPAGAAAPRSRGEADQPIPLLLPLTQTGGFESGEDTTTDTFNGLLPIPSVTGASVALPPTAARPSVEVERGEGDEDAPTPPVGVRAEAAEAVGDELDEETLHGAGRRPAAESSPAEQDPPTRPVAAPLRRQPVVDISEPVIEPESRGHSLLSGGTVQLDERELVPAGPSTAGRVQLRAQLLRSAERLEADLRGRPEAAAKGAPPPAVPRPPTAAPPALPSQRAGAGAGEGPPPVRAGAGAGEGPPPVRAGAGAGEGPPPVRAGAGAGEGPPPVRAGAGAGERPQSVRSATAQPPIASTPPPVAIAPRPPRRYGIDTDENALTVQRPKAEPPAPHPPRLSEAEQTLRRSPEERVPLPETRTRPGLKDAAVRGGGPGRVEQLRRLLVGESRVGWGGIAALFALVVAVGVGVGLATRSWRARGRVGQQLAAAESLARLGTWQGLRRAEESYLEILREREEPSARALRARTLGLLAVEFGESPEALARAVANLGEVARPEAEQARALQSLLAGRLDEARVRADAVHRSQASPESAYVLGRVELRLGHADLASRLFSEALERRPDDILLLHACGEAAWAKGEPEEARRRFERALERAPDHLLSLLDRAQLILPTVDDTERRAIDERLAALAAGPKEGLAPAERQRLHLSRAAVLLARVGSGPRETATALAGLLQRVRALLEEAEATGAPPTPSLAALSLAALDLDRAERTARQLLTQAPDQPALRAHLAEIARLRDQPADVLPLTDGRNEPELLMLRALALVASGQRLQALAAAESAVGRLPTHPATHAVLARVYEASGQPDRARKSLDKAVRLSVGEYARRPVAVALAEVEVPSGKSPDKLRLLIEEALRGAPLSIELRLAAARLARQQGRLADARRGLDEIVELIPSLRGPRRELAELSERQGDLATALKLLDALAQESGDPRRLLDAAELAMATGELERAAQRCQEVLKSARPEELRAEARMLLVRVKLAARDGVGAQHELELVPSMQRRLDWMFAELIALQLTGQPRRQRELLSALSGAQRQSPEVLAAEAHLLVESGRVGPARSTGQRAERAFAAVPPTRSRWVRADLLTTLGRCAWEQGSHVLAQRQLSEAVRLDPSSARAAYMLGLEHLTMARTKEAILELERAARLDPRLPDTQFDLGTAYAAQGDARAAEAFTRYLELAPNGQFAAKARRELAQLGTARPRATPTSDPPRTPRRGR